MVVLYSKKVRVTMSLSASRSGSAIILLLTPLRPEAPKIGASGWKGVS